MKITFNAMKHKASVAWGESFRRKNLYSEVEVKHPGAK